MVTADLDLQCWFLLVIFQTKKCSTNRLGRTGWNEIKWKRYVQQKLAYIWVSFSCRVAEARPQHSQCTPLYQPGPWTCGSVQSVLRAHFSPGQCLDYYSDSSYLPPRRSVKDGTFKLMSFSHQVLSPSSGFLLPWTFLLHGTHNTIP